MIARTLAKVTCGCGVQRPLGVGPSLLAPKALRVPPEDTGIHGSGRSRTPRKNEPSPLVLSTLEA